MYTGVHKMEEQDHGLADVLDWKLLDCSEARNGIRGKSIRFFPGKEYGPDYRDHSFK